MVQLSLPQSEYFPVKSGLQVAQVAQVGGSSQVVCHLAPTAICQVAGSDRGPRLGEKSVDLTKRSFSELFQILSRFCQKLEPLYLLSIESWLVKFDRTPQTQITPRAIFRDSVIKDSLKCEDFLLFPQNAESH